MQVTAWHNAPASVTPGFCSSSKQTAYNRPVGGAMQHEVRYSKLITLLAVHCLQPAQLFVQL